MIRLGSRPLACMAPNHCPIYGPKKKLPFVISKSVEGSRAVPGGTSAKDLTLLKNVVKIFIIDLHQPFSIHLAAVP